MTCCDHGCGRGIVYFLLYHYSTKAVACERVGSKSLQLMGGVLHFVNAIVNFDLFLDD